MAKLYGQVRIEATVPDGTATDSTLLAAAIAATLSDIVAINGIDLAELRTYQLELGVP